MHRTNRRTIILHEADGLQIGQRHEDGYINLTQMAQANGKLIADYLRLDITKAFLDELSMDMGIPISKLIQIRRGKPANLQGTWGHPQVAINCGQWCSAKFAVLVSQWVVEWMTTAQNLIQPQQPQIPSELLKEINTHLKTLEALNKVMHTTVHQHTGIIRAALGILETPGVSTELGSNKAESVPKLPPSKPQTAGRNPAVRRLKGEGSGSIHWRTYTRNGRQYRQAFFHYELWEGGNRLIKSCKYIPKEKVAAIQDLQTQKASIVEILRVLS
ncbi:MAG: KilA-N domain-containing protein [Microcystis sp. LE18-22.4A]|uniref:KilA-N domain-containing protein n=1 Tax=Microcystis sp. LE18-22.4A TaxID=3016432 RepID=UPI0022CADB54|nr:KilA-N domain-containing protein [Microcystis sp. LE18-22.4A]MCZ8118442.1 KilA-N domain-containing protein [Microcystis sp. LE18-22.4A]